MALKMSSGPLVLGGRGGLVIKGGSTVLDPTSITGLAAWFKADAITGKIDGDAIAQWNDGSGNNRHLAQATGSKQPLYKTAIQNSLPIVRFDGTDDTMKVAFTLNQPEHVFAVVKITSTSASKYLWDGGAVGDVMVLYQSLSAGNLRQYAGTNGASLTGISWATFHQVSALYNGASSEIRLDAAATATSVGAANAGGLAVGSNFGGTNNSAIDVAEILVYSAALSATDKGRVEAYLKSKWGTP